MCFQLHICSLLLCVNLIYETWVVEIIVRPPYDTSLIAAV